MAPARRGETSADDWLPALSSGAEDRALAERATLEAQAYARGVEETRAHERNRLDEQARSALAALKATTDRLSELQADLLRDRERDLQAMAVAIARHLVQQELVAQPALLETLVRRALDLLPLDLRIEIRLHPTDLVSLGAATASVVPEGRSVELVWVADPTLERGGFALETPQRIVDGRIDVALRDLYERLGHD